MTVQAMAEVRTASKTRSGCVECKRRKVKVSRRYYELWYFAFANLMPHLKCDEEKPTCARCRSRSVRCTYEFRLSWTQGRPFQKRRKQSHYQPPKGSVSSNQHDLISDTAANASSGRSIQNLFDATCIGLHVDGENVSHDVADFQTSSVWSSTSDFLASLPRSSKPSRAEDDLIVEYRTLRREELYAVPNNCITTSPSPCLAEPDTLLSFSIPLAYQKSFFLHHFCSQTASVIFPLSGDSNPLRGELLQAAFGTPHLLHALLASSARHYACLRGVSDESTSTAIVKFTHAALTGLRVAMNEPSQTHKMETVSTALALCTSDVISGNLNTWRIHLLGIHKLLLSALEHDSETFRNTDSIWSFLIKWFETLDMFAGISGLRKSTVRRGQYQSARRAGYIDEFVGCSLELMPLLAKIGRLARKQTKQIEYTYVTDNAGREDSRTILADEIQSTEKQIYSLLGRKVHPSFAQNPMNMTLAKDMENTHQAFVYASLLHLYRRVEQLPKNHIKPAHAVYQIVDTLQRIRPD